MLKCLHVFRKESHLLRSFHRVQIEKKYSRAYANVADDKFERERICRENRPCNETIYPLAKYGGTNLVALIIGSEEQSQMATYIQCILSSMGAPIDFEKIYLSDAATAACDTEEDTETCETILAIKRCGVGIKYGQFDCNKKRQNLMMSNYLDLYAAVVNVLSFPGLGSPHHGVDIVLIFQNNFGDYSKLEYEPVKDVVETLSITSRENIERFILYAFKYAETCCRKKITFVHKAIELPLYDGLFLNVARDLRCQFPDIEFEEIDIAKLAEKLVKDPNYFDVICLNEKYGPPITAIACGICGGVGVFSVSNYGDYYAVFQPIEGKLSITDREILSPFGSIIAAIHLLVHLGHQKYGKCLWQSLLKTTFEDKVLTKDLGGNSSADEVVHCIIKNFK